MTNKTITPPQVNQPKGSGSLEFDGLLAAFHAIVWATAEDDDPDLAYDEAGNVEAKKLQAMYRSLQSELTKARAEAEKWEAVARDFAVRRDELKQELDACNGKRSLPNLSHTDLIVLNGLVAKNYQNARRLCQRASTPVKNAEAQAKLKLAGDLMHALSNQSAPADKGEECVHDFRMFSGECHKCGADWIPGKEYAPAEKGEPVAFPGYPPVPEDRKLPADQPAPVAVVMPDFDTWYVKNRGVIGTAIYKNERKVWNACLDELARLNPIKQ